jgi:hypothetical protein
MTIHIKCKRATFYETIDDKHKINEIIKTTLKKHTIKNNTAVHIEVEICTKKKRGQKYKSVLYYATSIIL